MPQQGNSDFVCAECFDDDGLKRFCRQHAEATECDFCGATSEEPIAAPFDEVADHINTCVHRYYDDPANAGLPYESREGGWQGATYSSDEVLDALGLDFPNDVNSRLRDAVEAGLDTELWSDAEPYALSSYEQLSYSWEQFCKIVKHEHRYFFLHREKKSDRWIERDELLTPAQVLESTFKFAEDAGAFVAMPAGTRIFRARREKGRETFTTAGELGPPPLDHAIQTNRMSAPGVVMTYAAENRETALAETADGRGIFSVGEFVIERDLLILDLTQLPTVPSVFEELCDGYEYDPRPRLTFLRSVSGEISRPIARDDRIHIEYVPTQVVTEYVQTVVKVEGRSVDGIRYNSSRMHAQTALVLFADQKNLIFEGAERPQFYREEARWLRLVNVTRVTVTDGDIVRWAEKSRKDLFAA